MNADDTGEVLRRRLQQRTRHVTPKPAPDELIRRMEQRSARRQRRALVAVVAVLVIGLGAGYLLGHDTSDHPPSVSVAALDDGLQLNPAPPASLQPRDVPAAVAAVGTAFHDVFDGARDDSARARATQDGAALVALWDESRQQALRFGYTDEQLAGITIDVRDTMFIDDTHAVVHFSLTIPGRGDVLVDRTGYAIYADGTWKVSLRTACDILSLSGTTETCPPAP